MQQLRDVITIRKSFYSVSRWNIFFSAFYKPTSYYLADIYFCLEMMGMTFIAAYIFDRKWIALFAFLPMIIFLFRLDAALRNAYPFLDKNRDLEKSYRIDFRYLRFKLFADDLREKGLSIAKIKALKKLLKLEAQLDECHPPAVSRPAFVFPATVFLGILAASGGIEKFWIYGYWSVVIPMLFIMLLLICGFLDLFHPRQFYEKELEIFLEWYCIQDSTSF